MAVVISEPNGSHTYIKARTEKKTRLYFRPDFVSIPFANMELAVKHRSAMLSMGWPGDQVLIQAPKLGAEKVHLLIYRNRTQSALS